MPTPKKPPIVKKKGPAQPNSPVVKNSKAMGQGRKLVSSPGKVGALLEGAKESARVAGLTKGQPVTAKSGSAALSASPGNVGASTTGVSSYVPSPPTTVAPSTTSSVPPTVTPTRSPPLVPVVPPLLSSTAPVATLGPSVGLPFLPSASPILLLPYRLETRFVQTGSGTELWLRVYPDQISIDSHQEALSPAEATAGALFWNQSWTLAQPPAGDKEGPWRTIAAKFTPQRAAWIVKQMYPSNWPATLPASGVVGIAAPVPPNPPSTATAESVAATPSCLPDRWTAFIYPAVGSPLEFQFTSAVSPDLAITPDLDSEISVSSAGAAVPAAMQWMIDFDDAVTAGMAVRIPLTDPTMLTDGISRIVVLGIRASSVESDGSSILETLFDAHHYSDGLTFVPQGAPTKNTPTASSAYSRDDPGFETSYSTELGPPLATPNPTSGGSLVASALGLPTPLFDHIQNADRTEQANATAMLTALWPATLGYYLNQMMGIDAATIESARQFAVEHVFARGPYPAFRVGNVPYGILPTTSLVLLMKSNRRFSDPFTRSLLPLVQNSLSIWQQSIPGVPVVGPSGDPNGSLLEILGMAADPVAYNFRTVLGSQFMQNYLGFEGIPFSFFGALEGGLSAAGQQLLAKLGYPTASPFILQTGLSPVTSPISINSVYDGSPPTSETGYLQTPYTDPSDATKTTNYIGWLAGTDLGSIENQSLTSVPNTLLYVLLRHSLIRLAADLATAAAIQANVTVNNQPSTASSASEVELVNFPSQAPTQRPLDFLAATIPVPGVTSPGEPYAKFLRDPVMIAHMPQAWLDLQSSLTSLATSSLPPPSGASTSSSLSTAELDRLLSETLAVMGSRIDPWWTALPHALLPTPPLKSPVGVGGYAWLDGLTPNPPGAALFGAQQTSQINDLVTGISNRRGVSLATPTVYEAPADNAGYIHAPSLTQAATAAILRNGYVTQLASSPGAASPPLTIDLSSHRVRSALDLLDGLRAGDSLTALLGYQFESMMVADPQLAGQIPSFEAAYPLVANKLTLPPGPASAVAAPNVVDGVALLADYQANAPNYQALVGQLPSSSLADFTALMTSLQDGLSALGDIFTAEAVHQIQLGNPVRGGATLSAVESGSTPPTEIQVVQTPRSGAIDTHRVALLFPGDAPSTTGKPGDQNPRATAESWLHVWLRGLIPDPATVTCQYSIGPPDTSKGAPPLLYMTLDALGAGPVDFLAMSSADVTTPQLSELEARILDYIYNVSASPPPPGSPPVTLVYTRATSWTPTTMSVPEYLVVLRAFSDLLGGSRPLRPADLSPPASGRTVAGMGVSGTDVVGSATVASSALETAITEVQNARNSLWTSLQTPGPSPSASSLQQSLRAVSWFNLPLAIPADPTQARRLIPTAKISMGSVVAGAKTSASLTFALRSADALAAGAGEITIWTTPGTSLSSKPADYIINGKPVTANPVVSGNAVQLTVPASISASSQVTVAMMNVTNPTSLSGAITASAVTSGGTYASVDGDPLLVVLGSIAQADLMVGGFASVLPGLPSAVSSVAVALSGGAGALSMTVNFETGPEGALAAGAGTISISGPGGTVFSPSPNDYKVQAGSSSNLLSAAPKVTGSSVVITVPISVGPSTAVTVTINKISGTQPAAAQFSVWTSSDAMPSIGSTGVSVPGSAGGSSVSSVSVTQDVASAAYTLEFTTDNPLSANAGTVTVWAPNGVSFSPHAEDYLFSTAADPTPTAAPTDPQVNPGRVTVAVPDDIGAGVVVTLVIQSAQSPGAGSYGLSVATSVDTLAVVAPLSVPYGAKEATTTLEAVFGRSFIALPSFVPRNASDLVAAFTAPPSTSGDGSAVARWVQQLTHVHPAIRRLDHAMGLAQVAASAPAPSFVIGQLPVLPNDQWIALPSRSSVVAGSVTLDNPASGQAAQYTVSFTASPTGPLSGANGDWVVITAPAGTALPAGGYTLQGLAAGTGLAGSVALGTFGGSSRENQATIKIATAAKIPAGDLLTLIVTGVNNPSTASDDYQFLLYTSSDPQASATSPYSVTGDVEAGSVPTYTRGRLDLVVLPPAGFTPATLASSSTPLSGLWIDGWSERVPTTVETTGLAFHYAEPLTQAPQTLLLAVNPTSNDSWTGGGGLATLRTIVEETLEMAKVRAVDDLIRIDGGEFLPAVYCAFNPLGDTPSVDFKIIEPWYGKAKAIQARTTGP